MSNAKDVAIVSYATTNVIHWYDIADDLQKVQFNYDQQKLLDEATATTSSLNAQALDSLTATLAATLAGQSISKTVENKIDESGKATQTVDRKSEIAPPGAPPTVNFNVQIPAFPSTPPSGSSAADAQFKLRTAAALAEEIAIINKRVTSLPVSSAYRPYFVSFQLSVLPKQHHLPYDTTVELTFSIDDPNGRGSKLIVVPLLVTDTIEETKESQVAQVVRQLGTQLGGLAGPANVSAGLSRTLSDLAASESLRPNSLLTVGQLTVPKPDGTEEVRRNGLRVRLGANRFGGVYEMIPRTHNVSVVILVPLELARETPLDVQDPSLRRGENGRRFVQRYVEVGAVVKYSDAMPQAPAPADRSDGGHSPSTAGSASIPVELPDSVTISGAQFPLPPVPTATCPIQQTVIAKLLPDRDLIELALVGGRGFEGRRIEARLTTPPLGDGAGSTPLDLLAVSSDTADDGLQLYFPDHLQAIPSAAKAQVKTGTLAFTVLDSGDGEAALNCPIQSGPATPPPAPRPKSRAASGPSSAPVSGYKVAYILAASKGGAASQAAAATQPKAGKGTSSQSAPADQPGQGQAGAAQAKPDSTLSGKLPGRATLPFQ